MKPFDEFLRELRNGGAVEDLTEDLENCLHHVKESGKAATLTLTITLTPAGADRLFVADKVQAKLPKARPVIRCIFCRRIVRFRAVIPVN